MNHNGVEYILTPTADGNFWHWQFRMGAKTFSGKTETRLRALAIRRVEQRITTEQKKSAGGDSNSLSRVDDTGPGL